MRGPCSAWARVPRVRSSTLRCSRRHCAALREAKTPHVFCMKSRIRLHRGIQARNEGGVLLGRDALCGEEAKKRDAPRRKLEANEVVEARDPLGGEDHVEVRRRAGVRLQRGVPVPDEDAPCVRAELSALGDRLVPTRDVVARRERTRRGDEARGTGVGERSSLLGLGHRLGLLRVRRSWGRCLRMGRLWVGGPGGHLECAAERAACCDGRNGGGGLGRDDRRGRHPWREAREARQARHHDGAAEARAWGLARRVGRARAGRAGPARPARARRGLHLRTGGRRWVCP